MAQSFGKLANRYLRKDVCCGSRPWRSAGHAPVDRKVVNRWTQARLLPIVDSGNSVRMRKRPVRDREVDKTKMLLDLLSECILISQSAMKNTRQKQARRMLNETYQERTTKPILWPPIGVVVVVVVICTLFLKNVAELFTMGFRFARSSTSLLGSTRPDSQLCKLSTEHIELPIDSFNSQLFRFRVHRRGI